MWICKYFVPSWFNCWTQDVPYFPVKLFAMSQIMVFGPPLKKICSSVSVEKIKCQTLQLHHHTAGLKHSTGGTRRKTHVWLSSHNQFIKRLNQPFRIFLVKYTVQSFINNVFFGSASADVRLTLIMNGGLFNMPAVARLSKLSVCAFNHWSLENPAQRFSPQSIYPSIHPSIYQSHILPSSALQPELCKWKKKEKKKGKKSFS